MFNDTLLSLGFVILYSEKWDPIGGRITDINDVWMRINSEDGMHIIRIGDVNHIKVPNDNIAGFDSANV